MQSRHALEILPPEQWEAVLLEFGVDDLLGLSRVCATFSELSVHILQRQRDVFGGGYASLSLLRIFALYARSHRLPMERINLVLKPSVHVFEVLDEIIQRASQLRQITLAFTLDLLSLHQLNTRDKAETSHTLTRMLSRVAQRVHGAVIVTYPGQIYRIACAPTDLAQWELHQFHFDPPNLFEAWLIRKRSKGRLYPQYVPIRRQNQHRLHWVTPLTSLQSVDLQLLDSPETGPPPVSLLHFNKEAVRGFTSWLPSATSYAHVLRHSHYPSLETLRLESHLSDQTALRRFLENHPQLHTIEFRPKRPPKEARALQLEVPSHPLVDPPLAHPSLVALTCNSNGCGRVLEGLLGSPKLTQVSFALEARAAPSRIRAFTRELQALAAHSAPGTIARITFRLALQEPAGTGIKYRISKFHPLRQTTQATRAWAQAPHVLALAAQTTLVRALCLFVSSIDTATMLFPWIAAFPALQSVEFVLKLRYDTQNTKEAFLTQARTKIGNSTQVFCT
ncbi:hypothetical protein MIND_01226700 [Mycena indigotica]|uniref:F-box domain-containing protein n=1 Tax=Mycena indigotica TaxID=2126181 RepID=A0A8H6S2H1_9AGAR|nr:uncharacterized protein MIND_01226700 [Mycena indigotica]KAF7292010.1 hypothetical protein MIND_01226700 [Mycena indigotica]